MRLPRYLMFVPLALVAAGRAPAEIGGPSLGFVYDKTARTLRLISGITGASVVGDPIDLGFPAAAASVSSRQDFALALDAGAGEVRLVRLESDRVTAVSALAGAMPAPDRMVLSAGASGAALYRESSGRIQIFSGLPLDPSLKREIVLLEPIAVQAIAVSDDAELLVLAGDGAAWLVMGAASPIRLNIAPPVRAAAIRSGSHDTVLAADGGRVLLARGLGANLAFDEIGTASGDEAQPLATGFSADGARVHVVLENGLILSTGLQSGVSSRVSCRCIPAGLERMKPGSVFRLNDLSSAPVMLFDATSGEPEVWFVPAPARGEGGQL